MDNYLVALDFETTGLDPENSRIIEIGAIKFSDSGEEIDTFESFVDPCTNIPIEISKLTGISNDMVKGSPNQNEALIELFKWAGNSKVYIAHNATFEAKFIKAQFNNPPEIFFIDTLEISRRRLKNEKSYKLIDLVPEGTIKRHRALSDARACKSLFHRLSATYKQGKIPLERNLKPINDIQINYPPSEKQLAYIRNLGGDAELIKNKKQASLYIDKLKNKSNNSSSKVIDYFFRFLLLIIFIAIIWDLIK